MADQDYGPGVFDAYTPRQVNNKVQDYSAYKRTLPVYKQVMLGVVAGGYIGLGVLFFLFITADGGASGTVLFIGGLVFSLGYVMCVLTGSEVFTSDNLQAMCWASGVLSTRNLLRRWALVLFANVIGSAGVALLVLFSGILVTQGDGVATYAYEVASRYTELGFREAFFRGLLGNLMICIAIWISFSGRTVTDKLLSMALIISAVPILNLEHVVASFFYVAFNILLPIWYPGLVEAASGVAVATTGSYLLAVTLGNIVGGSGMVALVYYLVYR